MSFAPMHGSSRLSLVIACALVSAGPAPQAPSVAAPLLPLVISVHQGGEDLDNGALDGLGGYIEDRNHDRLLNDRPFPDPSDVIFLHDPFTGAIVRRLPPFYPYGHPTPHRGGDPSATAVSGAGARFESGDLSIQALADGGWEVRIRFMAPARPAGSADERSRAPRSGAARGRRD